MGMIALIEHTAPATQVLLPVVSGLSDPMDAGPITSLDVRVMYELPTAINAKPPLFAPAAPTAKVPAALFPVHAPLIVNPEGSPILGDAESD